MNVPVSGIILAPLSVAILLFRPSRLAEWAIFVSIFQAAAVANIGAFGVGPYFFVVILIASRLIPEWLTGRVRYFRDEAVVKHMQMMTVFVGWTVFSAFISPILFAGTPVDDPRVGVDASYLQQMPLKWSFSNAGQAAYVVLNFLLLLQVLQMSERSDYLKRLQQTFSWSGACVVVIGAYQIACAHVGLRFPTWLFNSNAAWAQLYNQNFDGVSRLTASFSEPSTVAAFLAAWVVFEMNLVMTEKQGSTWHWLCVVGGTIALIETASTTGYVTVGFVWIVICGYFTWFMVSTGRVKVKMLVAVSTVIIGAAVALYTVPSAQSLVNGVLFEKSTSASSTHRMASVGRATGVFYATLTLGAGIGSNRAMSMPAYVLSNLGLPGTVLFVWLISQLYAQYFQWTRQGSDYSTRHFIKASGAAFVTNLLAMAFSGAEITGPLLWILWAMLLAGIRRAWLSDYVSQMALSA
ncbi:MAG: hypothetical protein JO121_05055 [Deltaproteobacteria bacterium]|nr:hypothetical protein [Deltaproteobacteria bacterium]